MTEFTIKPMTREDLGIAVSWAAREGWNPGIYDLDCFLGTDPGGFLGGFIQDELVASISVVRYGPDFGFLGFYIVRPDWRGQGYGLKLWQAGMELLGTRNVGLDGVVDQQDNYRKSGFVLAYNNARYQGQGGGECPDSPDLVGLDEVSRDQVLEYDRGFFPADRRNFLERWLVQPESHGYGVVREGKLVGYGMARACLSGYKIGPLFADNAQDAGLLLDALGSSVPTGQPVFLDIPETNVEARALVQTNNMEKVFETARMYNREAPGLPVDHIFGVTSFELG